MKNPDSRTSRRRAAAAAIVLALALGTSTLHAQDDLRVQADRAYTEERHQDAIELYRQVVAQDPADLFSRKRLALLLSWNDRLDEAIAVYGAILAENPHDEEAKRERAKVYAWAGRVKESEAAYRELLAARPGDPELQIRYAEVLSWDGQYEEARELYLDLVARNERAADASVGLGNVALWEGDLDDAERWYRRALVESPGNVTARVGLARVLHARGLTEAATRELDAIQKDAPNDREARRLRSQIEATTRSSASASFTRLIDTDDNDLRIGRLWGTWFLDPQSSLTFTYLRHEPTSNCTLIDLCLGPGSGLPALGERFTNNADTLLAAYDGRVTDKVGVRGSLGGLKRSFFSGDSAADVIGGAGVRLYPTQDLVYGFDLGREAILDTALLVENEIDFTNLGGNVVWGFAPQWSLRANAVASWISDGNQRLSAYGWVGWRVPVARPRATVAFSTRALAYDENPGSGYFSPESLWTNLLDASVGDEFLRRHLYYSVNVQLAVQKIRLFTEPGSTDSGDRGWDSVFGWSLIGGWKITDRVAFETSYGRTDQAQQSATGFEQSRWSFLLRGEF
jgi:tetratricopeptide (TPR) repeat protein